MADENKKGGVDNTIEEAQTDAFGMDNKPAPAPAPAEGEGDKGGEGKGGDKKFEAIPEDHPTIVALKQEIEKVKTDKEAMGGNLSAQRELIKVLEGKVDALTQGNGKGGKAEGADDDVLYKNIKWSKDLTKEQREEMTDTEIAQMDELAEVKTKQNEMYAEQKRKEREAEEEAKSGKNKAVEDLQSLVKSTALELSKGEDGKENTEIANAIIESTKQFNLTGLTEAQVKERVASAHKLIPNYTPPKEQTNKRGNAMDGNGKGGDDPFGTGKIIEEATKKNDGSYSL